MATKKTVSARAEYLIVNRLGPTHFAVFKCVETPAPEPVSDVFTSRRNCKKAARELAESLGLELR